MQDRSGKEIVSPLDSISVHSWCPRVTMVKEVRSAAEANALIETGWVVLRIHHSMETLLVVLGWIGEAADRVSRSSP